MGFAVFHASKGKSSGSSLGAHIDRDEKQKQSFKNADPDRSALNVDFQVAGTGKKLNEAIRTRITEGYKGNKDIRKDAVTHLSLIFTGTHEDMKAIEQDKEKMQKWIERNYNFVIREFGKENIMRFTLHRDERTPHIHAVVVPLTAEGKLTAREVLGGRMAMSARQTRYGQAMAEFGLERGVIGSKAIHNSEGWYLGQQKKEQEAVLSQLPSFGALERINPKPFLEKVTERLEIAAMAKVDAELKAERVEKRYRNELKELKEENGILQERRDKLSLSNGYNKQALKLETLLIYSHKKAPDNGAEQDKIFNDIAMKMGISENEFEYFKMAHKDIIENQIKPIHQKILSEEQNKSKERKHDRGEDQSRGR